MKKFKWEIKGNGNINLVILNGWGFNSEIWFFIIKKLCPYFKLHLIDLPGIGRNKKLIPINIQQIIEVLNFCMPNNSVYLGWSLGGLIATNFALLYPNKILGLINVASSPCFIKKKNWPGIEKKKLYCFYRDLVQKNHDTINNFLFSQIFQEKKHLKDLNVLTNKLFQSHEKPNQHAIKKGLEMLLKVDLRSQLPMIRIPFLRIYGSLDTLVPKKISNLTDVISNNSSSVIINQAGHIPFISHKEEFCSILLEFFKKI